MLQGIEPAYSHLQDSVTKQKLWLAAIKPPMYSVAIIPITTGTGLYLQIFLFPRF
jgi:2-carboxy-1,4-naphthoquinone phytyltransferase